MAEALSHVVGRERELAELAAFLTAIPDGPTSASAGG